MKTIEQAAEEVIHELELISAIGNPKYENKHKKTCDKTSQNNG